MRECKAHADKPRLSGFGEWLTTWRIAKGMRQSDLAKVLDVHPGRISELETGARIPRQETVRRLQEVLGDGVPPAPPPCVRDDR